MMITYALDTNGPSMWLWLLIGAVSLVALWWGSREAAKRD